MTTNLSGQHALVTGGGKGIGLAIARALTAAGASVTIIGRDEAALAAAVTAGGAQHYAILDVTDEGATLERLGQLGSSSPFDIVVANAGSADTATFGKCDAAFFNRMLSLNLMGVVTSFRAALPPMVKRKHGRLIAIASTAGHRGYAYATAYSAAKHAVIGLVRSLALETAKTGVTVNAICPGYTDTDLVAGSVRRIVEKGSLTADAAMSHFVQDNPMGRLVRPEEVAAAALYLCGPHAGATTGQSIMINGGEF